MWDLFASLMMMRMMIVAHVYLALSTCQTLNIILSACISINSLNPHNTITLSILFGFIDEETAA